MELRYKQECKIDTEDHKLNEVLQKQALNLHMVPGLKSGSAWGTAKFILTNFRVSKLITLWWHPVQSLFKP